MKAIKGFEKLYSVTSTGKVYSHRNKIYLKARKNRGGYLYVNLKRNQKSTSKTIHRMVITAFSRKSKLHINHMDGDKTNNNLSNLEYVTAKQNVRHYWLKNTGLDYKTVTDKKMQEYREKNSKIFKRNYYLKNCEEIKAKRRQYWLKIKQKQYGTNKS